MADLSNIGTRRRFLYRLIVYPLLPLLALYLILSRLGDRDSDLVGLLGLILGLVALYLFFGRLKRPFMTVRYAVNPLRTVREVLRSSASKVRSQSDGLPDVEKVLQATLPDVVTSEMPLDQSGAHCLRVGDEVLVCFGPSPQNAEEADALAAALDAARTPLHEESVLLLLTQPTDQALLVRLQERLPRLLLMSIT